MSDDKLEVFSGDELMETFEGYKNKMKSRLFGLLCEREKDGEWEKFLDTIYLEILGYACNLNSIKYWFLLGKISSLKYLSFEYFRKTIFECMNLITTLNLRVEDSVVS